MIGTVTRDAAAAMFPFGAVNCDSPVKNASAAGTVCAPSFEDVSVIANRKSFQQKMKTRIAAVFDPHERHEVRANTEARLLLVLAPWPGDGHPGARD